MPSIRTYLIPGKGNPNSFLSLGIVKKLGIFLYSHLKFYFCLFKLQSALIV